MLVNNSRLRRNRHFADEGGVDDIMEIPDLEDEDPEEDITTQVAAAPRNTTKRVQSMRELDKEVATNLPNTMQHGINLSILTKALCPLAAVDFDPTQEEMWDFDPLLQHVSQALQADLDAREKEDAELKAEMQH